MLLLRYITLLLMLLSCFNCAICFVCEYVLVQIVSLLFTDSFLKILINFFPSNFSTDKFFSHLLHYSHSLLSLSSYHSLNCSSLNLLYFLLAKFYYALSHLLWTNHFGIFILCKLAVFIQVLLLFMYLKYNWLMFYCFMINCSFNS